MADSMGDPFESDAPAAPAVPTNSPLSSELREAIVWARANGVAEMELPAGRFILRPPAPSSAPTMADLQEKLGGKVKPVIGGFDPNLLFAASPNPYVPDSEEPIPMPGAPAK